MTVTACLQAGTRADVVWLVDSEDLPVADWSDAIVLTPGGGKTGSLVAGALDGKLTDLVGLASQGRLVDVELTEVDAMISELPSSGSARALVFPAESLPAELWELATARRPFCVVSRLSGEDVDATHVYSEESVSEADTEVQEALSRGISGSILTDERVISVFVAVPQMVVVGSGPVAESVAALGRFLGWEPRLTTEAAAATGLIAPLSGNDKVIIAAHDLELAGAALTAAIESRCGYIGSVGSRKMQADRADWLAYRGVTDLTRVNGPAGLDIGADTPAEIAVSIVGEAIAMTGGG